MRKFDETVKELFKDLEYRERLIGEIQNCLSSGDTELALSLFQTYTNHAEAMLKEKK